ncbi:MAG: polysaccharide deacetylase family protein [Clostridia bacterium]
MKNKNFEKYLKIAKKRILVIFCVFAIVLVTSVAVAFRGNQSITTSAEITNWGLSFQTDGQCPIGNESAEFLAEYDSYFVGDTESNEIYLTFDAGYENGNMETILEVLEKHNVTATFFLVGNYLETEPELVKLMADSGHYVANHTWSHLDMSQISDIETFAAEITAVEEKYYEITGTEMVKLYRPPQGKFSVQNLEMAQELGYSTIFWSLAYVDWYEDDQPTTDEAFDKLLSRIHGGAIVLLHSTSSTNAEILDELLTKWEEMGYTFGDIMQLCS